MFIFMLSTYIIGFIFFFVFALCTNLMFDSFSFNVLLPIMLLSLIWPWIAFLALLEAFYGVGIGD